MALNDLLEVNSLLTNMISERLVGKIKIERKKIEKTEFKY